MSSNSALVIIGASDGIGYALSNFYQKNGKKVYTGSRGNSDFNDHFNLDVSTGHGLDNLVANVREDRVTVIVTAGILGRIGPIELISESDWIDVFRTNFLGAINVYKSFREKNFEEAKIIFFSGGGVGGKKHQSRVIPYVVFKTALVSLIEEISNENLEGRPVVCAVAPGAFPTKFTDAIASTSTEVSGLELKKEYEINKNKLPNFGNLIKLINFIECCDPRLIDGRLLSANFDSPEDIALKSEQSLSDSNSYGKLRRIEFDQFLENKL